MNQKDLTLEAMSAIYHIFLNQKDQPIPAEVQHRLLSAYALLQHTRDDSSYLKISVDLTDKLLIDQRKARLSELRATPFNLDIDQAIEYEEGVAKDPEDADRDSVRLGRNVSSDNI